MVKRDPSVAKKPLSIPFIQMMDSQPLPRLPGSISVTITPTRTTIVNWEMTITTIDNTTTIKTMPMGETKITRMDKRKDCTAIPPRCNLKKQSLPTSR